MRVLPRFSCLAAASLLIYGTGAGGMAPIPESDFVQHRMNRVVLKPWTLVPDKPHTAIFHVDEEGTYAIRIGFHAACGSAIPYLPPWPMLVEAADCLWETRCSFRLRLHEVDQNDEQREVLSVLCSVVVPETDLDDPRYENHLWLVPSNQLYLGAAIVLQNRDVRLVPGMLYSFEFIAEECAFVENPGIRIFTEFVNFEVIGSD